MNRVRRCEFISAWRIPLDPTPGADGQKEGRGLNGNVLKCILGREDAL